VGSSSMPETPSLRIGSRRIACSGRARSVLDHIDKLERDERLRQRHRIELKLPVVNQPGHWMTLTYSHPMTQEEWDGMRAMLDLFRPGITASGQDAS
jgi:hypothetical protein